MFAAEEISIGTRMGEGYGLFLPKLKIMDFLLSSRRDLAIPMKA